MLLAAGAVARGVCYCRGDVLPAKFLYCCSRISYFVHKHDHEFHILPTSLPAGYIEYFICLLPRLALIFLVSSKLCKPRGYIENFICPLPRYNLICGVKTAHFSLYTLLPLKIFNFPLIFCSFCAIAGYFEVTFLYIPRYYIVPSLHISSYLYKKHKYYLFPITR